MKYRRAEPEDLHDLLALYTQLRGEIFPETDSELRRQWSELLSDPKIHIIVAEDDHQLVSSCTLTLIPNLTHGQRPYGVIENMVTDRNHRGCSFATGCLLYARDMAEKSNCYKLMLLTGAKDEKTLSFYERAGFNRRDKTAFILWLEEREV